MTMLRRLMTVVVMLAGLWGVVGAQEDVFTLTVINDSDIPICGIEFWSHYFENEVSSTSEGQILSPGQLWPLLVERDVYYIDILNCDQDILETRPVFLVSDHITLHYPSAEANMELKAYDLMIEGKNQRINGKFDEAKLATDQALAIWQQLGNIGGQAISYKNIALYMSDVGDNDRAVQFYEESKKLCWDICGVGYQADLLHNLGTLYIQQRDIVKAFDYFQQSLNIVKDPALRTTTLNQIAQIRQTQERHEEALDIYNEVLAYRRDVGDWMGTSITLGRMAKSYAALCQIDEMTSSLDEALEICELNHNILCQAESLLYRGRIYERIGSSDSYADAIASYQSAFNLIDETNYNYLKLSVLRAMSDILNEMVTRPGVYVYGFCNTAGMEGGGLDPQDKYQLADMILAYEDTLQLAEQVFSQTTNLDNSTALLLQQFAPSYRRLAHLHYQNGNLEEALSVSERGKAFLVRVALATQPVENESAPEITTANLPAIQAAIPANTALIAYSVDPGWDEIASSTMAFIITSTSVEVVEFGWDDVDVKFTLDPFHLDRKANAATVMQGFYKGIFEPLADKIPSGTTRLMISADGALNYVPFAALQNAETGRYLIEDYAISMIPSGTTLVLLNNRGNAPATQPILAISQSSAPPLPKLMYADSEAETIAALFQTEAVTNATEADLRANVAGSGILHISAHAELNPFNFLYSVIHLAPDAAGQYDGRLDVREIYELDLSATELVILSGCDTGSGGDGEDFGIMNRAFFGAGAQKVVSSLWSVDDEATADLLTAFMTARTPDGNDADALRTAMLAIKDKYPNQPYYWASFVLTGVPDH